MELQGKRPEQYKNSAKFAGYGIIAMVILLIILSLFGGCSTVKDTSEKPCCKKEATK
mgnify:CR=1 FL=1|tara:strand:+ start:251 stop:421 length:171 start_codon:yes stop_codon:yes gene_type:complete